MIIILITITVLVAYRGKFPKRSRETANCKLHAEVVFAILLLACKQDKNLINKGAVKNACEKKQWVTMRKWDLGDTG